MKIIAQTGEVIQEEYPPQGASYVSGYTFEGSVVHLTVEGSVMNLVITEAVGRLSINGTEINLPSLRDRFDRE